MNNRLLAVSLCGLALVCAALTVVSLSTIHWTSYSVFIEGQWAEVRGGLFEVCATVLETVCVEIQESDLSSTIKATQAFLIIATILLVANIVNSGFMASGKSSPKSVAALFGAAAVSTGIAMAVFTAETPIRSEQVILTDFSYGYSFIIGWVAFALNLILVAVPVCVSADSEYTALP